jgi:hypothetical protein
MRNQDKGIEALLPVPPKSQDAMTPSGQRVLADPVGEGDPFLWEPGLEGFFDRAPLHLHRGGH